MRAVGWFKWASPKTSPKTQPAFHSEIANGWSSLIPVGTRHNIIETGNGPMQIYAIYAPAGWPAQPSVTPTDP
jgi:oxalate decarboxylase/phosphoglucose isomerase-like protein (cupin superfamily)